MITSSLRSGVNIWNKSSIFPVKWLFGMAHVKNYETVCKYVKAMQRKTDSDGENTFT